MRDNHNNFEIVREILRIAQSVQMTQKQGVLDIPINSRKYAEDLKYLSKEVIREHNKNDLQPINNVSPWIWSKKTSGSPALTENGNQHGFELRFSVRSKGKTIESIARTGQAEIVRATASVAAFDALYAQWEEQALRKAKFEAEKVVGKDLIPEVVKRKVERLWERGICYPDEVEPASFRLTDSKGGGPYNCFSYYPSNRTIYLNREYLVQLAAFLDLIDDYGYLPQWLAFEHNESTPVASVSIDICIKLPDGRKIFVEVKERKDQREALISAVKSLGAKGVDLSVEDRSNDPLRKAKYILSGRPDFFAGYCPEGFDAYLVTNQVRNRFTLEPTDLPDAHSLTGNPR